MSLNKKKVTLHGFQSFIHPKPYVIHSNQHTHSSSFLSNEFWLCTCCQTLSHTHAHRTTNTYRHRTSKYILSVADPYFLYYTLTHTHTHTDTHTEGYSIATKRSEKRAENNRIFIPVIHIHSSHPSSPHPSLPACHASLYLTFK